MHFHSNDFVTLVCTSDDDSCFTPIDKELAGRLQLTSKSLLKRKQFWWITAISVDHRNCRFVYVSTVTVVNNSCEFRQAKRHTRDSRCVLFASCVAALGHFLVLLLLPRIGGLHPARVVMASDDVPNRERQDKCASPAQRRHVAPSRPLQNSAGRHSGSCQSCRQSTVCEVTFLCSFVT